MQRRKTILISLKLLPLLAILMFIQVQCRHQGLDVNTLTPVCYDSEIEPIFLNKCATCHGQNKHESGVRFDDYNSILNSLTPFDAQKSKVYQAITGKAFSQLMPPDGALSENERILIRVWIDQGAKRLPCSVAIPVVN